MPNVTILGHLGLFVRPGFLNPASCHLIRAEMASASAIPAMIRPVGQAGGVLDEATRRTGVANVSASTNSLIEDQLRLTMPALEKHFQVTLTGWQKPQFYIYEEGDFFVVHRDKDEDPDAPEWVRSRQVSVSIFLNDGKDGPDAQPYRGGALVFYGARGDRSGEGFKIPLDGEEGMFVGFRSDWFHEVRPITSGRRYSIVTWFY
jgi:predicted 2-oxoglutarate/Fe(II)-dependent dioxygenase YbiX